MACMALQGKNLTLAEEALAAIGEVHLKCIYNQAIYDDSDDASPGLLLYQLPVLGDDMTPLSHR